MHSSPPKSQTTIDGVPCAQILWTVSDNGSDPIILCRQIEQGFAYSFPASHKNFVEDIAEAKTFLSRNLSTYAKSVHKIFHEEYSVEECMAAGKSFIDSLSALYTELNKI